MVTNAKTVAEALLDILDGLDVRDLKDATGMNDSDAKAIMDLRSKLLDDKDGNRGFWGKNTA